ncbi:uncharacterized protein LOC131841531, partial [Achroia grisella]
MDKYLRPERFDADPSANIDQSPLWIHWKQTFENFISAINTKDNPITPEQQYQVLVNYLSPILYAHIKECNNYTTAILKLNQLFTKPVNEIYSRHRLMKRYQQSGESVHQYIQALKLLSKECNFHKVTAEQNESEYIRDAFIGGLVSPVIRQRLLENSTLTLDAAFQQAQSLELAEIHNQNYLRDTNPVINNTNNCSNIPVLKDSMSADNKNTDVTVAATPNYRNTFESCYFCGEKRHPRRFCPAASSTCLSCGKRGHFAKVCRNKSQRNAATSNENQSIETLSCILSAADLSKATVPIIINNKIMARALIDTGSTASFIDKRLVNHYDLIETPYHQKITMAKSNLISHVKSRCALTIEIQKQKVEVNLMVMEGLCSDVILGHDMLSEHKSLEMQFGGFKPS